MNTNIEELITALYDMIQDAKAVPLSSERCIIERDRALDLLDEISAQLPGELKQARTIVQSREELVSQARREAETVVRNAREEAERLVDQQNIYIQARQRCEELVQQTQEQMNQLKRVSNEYIANALLEASETIQKALGDVQGVRAKFVTMTDVAPQASAVAQEEIPVEE